MQNIQSLQILRLRKHRPAFLVLMLFAGITVLVPTVKASDLKPKYGPDAVPLSASPEYFKNHFPPLFWKIIPYYVHQQNPWTCGIVSSAMVLNAVRAILKITPTLTADDPLFYEEDLLQYLKNNRALSQYSGRGLALSELGIILNAIVKDFKLGGMTIEAVILDQDAQLPAKEQHLHEVLVSLEKSDRHLMIANFNQSVFTSDADIGHYSPVAAYDSKNQKVLILDTDRHWYEPYWVKEKVFMSGMKTQDKSVKKNRGFIHIELLENAK